MDDIKVALLMAKGDMDPGTGNGIHKYMYEVYRHMVGRRKGIHISKIESQIYPGVGVGMSFYMDNMFKDFSKYDIIHNMDFKPLNPVMKNGAAWLSTVHDLQPILYPQYNYDFEAGPKNRIWSELVIKNGIRMSLNSDFIIARSTQTRDEILGFGYGKSRIFIISDGVDDRYFKSQRRVPHKGFVVGYLGALRAKKNPQFAVDAFRHVSDKSITLQVWGKKEFSYDDLVRRAGSDKRIRFMGFAPEDKIVGIYDGFDVFVFPSLHEGFGIPIIEAQARGLPVIIYKKARIPDEVRRFCIEAKDEEHMARIIEDLKEKGYNEKQRKRSTEYARSFTWKKEADETLDVYYKIASKY